MDKVNNYRRILRRLVNDYARFKPSHGQIEPIAICDARNDNYVLVHLGWDGIRRIHSTVFHLRLRDGKVLIEEDGLEQGVANELLKLGVVAADIVYSLEKQPRALLKKAA